MMRTSEKAEQTPPKIKAEDNPWYLLATLYGVPGEEDEDPRSRNRIAWNRYFANLDEKTRARLIQEKRRPAEELMPFSLEELQEVEIAFAARCWALEKEFALPDCEDAIDFSIDFSNVEFDQDALFREYLFSCVASFEGATFSGKVDFCKRTFREGCRATRFGGTTSFVNAEMKGETSFEEAIFQTEPPKFFGAKLHQGTVWRDIKPWPLPKDKKEAGAFIDAYACLKLEMDRLKKHEDELDFFALELQSRRVLQGLWRGLPSAIYELLSNYGRTYVRPLVWLIGLALVCAPAYWHCGTRAPVEALGLSLANMLSILGFRKDFGLSVDDLPAILKTLSAVQAIVGGALLFLFGLGIRNKFRMK
jgi:hypothetical protein